MAGRRPCPSPRTRRIGVLMAYPANDPQAQARNAAFVQGLQQLGWVVGNNVAIDYRWSGGIEDDTRRYAAELVAHAPGKRALENPLALEPAGSDSIQNRSPRRFHYVPEQPTGWPRERPRRRANFRELLCFQHSHQDCEYHKSSAQG